MKKFLLGLVFLFTMVAGVFVYTCAYANCVEGSIGKCIWDRDIQGHRCWTSGPYNMQKNCGGGGSDGDNPQKPDDIYNGTVYLPH